jgi:hypothetical protein
LYFFYFVFFQSDNEEFLNEDENYSGPKIVSVPPGFPLSSSTSVKSAAFRVVMMREDCEQHIVYNQNENVVDELPSTYNDLMTVFTDSKNRY